MTTELAAAMSEYKEITEHGYYGPGPGEAAVAVPCPACGAVIRFGRGYWERSMVPQSQRNSAGTSFRVVAIIGIFCPYCDAVSPVRDWHRAYEARAVAAAGFITPRMMKAAEVRA